MSKAIITSEELMQAQAEICCLSYSYIKSMALRCAVKLGIPDAIHRSGGAATLPDLLSAIPLPETKRTHLSRLMRMLTALGIFSADDGGVVYHLTPVSRLLVDDVQANGGACLSQFATSVTASLSSNLTAFLRLDEWLRADASAAAETPFMMAYGTYYWGASAAAAGHDGADRSARFQELMASDSRLVAEVVVRDCGEVFEGITSLVDVGGGSGVMAKAIAKAFPHVRCSVLELPHVIDGIGGGDDHDKAVEFVAGNMMDSIPPADAVLLKNVLHDWSDEDCVSILRRCREAISGTGQQGKVVIIDMVVEASPLTKEAFEAQLLMDLCMMVLLTGKERQEELWNTIFINAGFTRYKIRPVLGSRSIIEVYP